MRSFLRKKMLLATLLPGIWLSQVVISCDPGYSDAVWVDDCCGGGWVIVDDDDDDWDDFWDDVEDIWD